MTLDLPGHGEDGTSPVTVTLQNYAERVCEVIDEQPEPVVLVGHSMGGIVISEAAERRPEKIEKLVYLTAFLLPDGKTLLETAQADSAAIILQNVDVDEGNGVITLKSEGVKDVLYHDCSDEDAEWAKDRIGSQPLAPFGTPVGVTEDNFGSVRRTYISCANDRAISPDCQNGMLDELPCEEVVTMQTGHSPFLAAPEELAGHLDSLAKL